MPRQLRTLFVYVNNVKNPIRAHSYMLRISSFTHPYVAYVNLYTSICCVCHAPAGITALISQFKIAPSKCKYSCSAALNRPDLSYIIDTIRITLLIIWSACFLYRDSCTETFCTETSSTETSHTETSYTKTSYSEASYTETAYRHFLHRRFLQRDFLQKGFLHRDCLQTLPTQTLLTKRLPTEIFLHRDLITVMLTNNE